MEPEKCDFSDRNFVYGDCLCSLDSPANYAIKIPKVKGTTTYVYKCDKCQMRGTIHDKSQWSIKYEEYLNRKKKYYNLSKGGKRCRQ